MLNTPPPKTVTYIFDDLDFGTKEMILPEEIYVKYGSYFTYHSKAIAIIEVFEDKQKDGQTDGPKTICPRCINAWA